jgi:hypothetical protein
MRTELSGLKNFIGKLQNYKSPKIACDKVAESVAKRGVEIAEKKYGAKGIKGVAVSYAKLDDQHYEILAKGEAVSFIEFGTGNVGKGTYHYKGESGESRLPTQTIEFIANKEQKSTHGWIYAYPNPLRFENGVLKGTKTHKGEWKWQGRWFSGQVAGAEMFGTAIDLKKEMPSIVKIEIRGD